MSMSRADDGAPEPTAETEPRESWSTPVSDLRSDEPPAIEGRKRRTGNDAPA
jgi:hypothetical protein